MEGIIQQITPEGDFDTNNVYSISLDNGTTAKCYVKKGSFKDKKFASGEAIGEKMVYELSAKGNFASVKLGDYAPPAGGYSTPSSNGYSKPASGGYSGGNDSRQVSIVRQSMLKAAVDFLSGKQGVKKEHVLDLAESFETWVNRVEATAAEVSPAQQMPRTAVTPPAQQPPLEVVAKDDLPF